MDFFDQLVIVIFGLGIVAAFLALVKACLEGCDRKSVFCRECGVEMDDCPLTDPICPQCIISEEIEK